MKIQELLKINNMTIYRLAKQSAVPYATVNDICHDKTSLEKCSGETIYKLSQALNVSMEELLSPYMEKRPSFENYKSSICHRVHAMGDLAFIQDVLEQQDIRHYYERRWYPESLYLLAMLDYLCRENNLPLCDEYDDLRRQKLEKPVYPSGILALAAAEDNTSVITHALEAAIPEFLRFNIIESEVRTVA